MNKLRTQIIAGCTAITCCIILSGFSILISQTKDWQKHTDSHHGYSVEFPADWDGRGGKGGFICNPKDKPDSDEWVIGVSDLDNEERIKFLNGELFERKNLQKKAITISGIEAMHSTYTVDFFPKRIYETVILKTETKFFLFENSGLTNEDFTTFYQSFKIDG